jgi:hypothetical protein
MLSQFFYLFSLNIGTLLLTDAVNTPFRRRLQVIRQLINPCWIDGDRGVGCFSDYSSQLTD